MNRKNCMYALGLSLLFVLGSCADEKIIRDSADDFIEEVETADNVAARSSKSVKLNINNVTASATQSPNVPSRILDGKLSTRWSGFGDPTDLVIDMGTAPKIDYVKIAFFKGNQRRADFEVWVRTTSNSSWEKINTKRSSGNTTGLEIFDLSNRTAQFLRLRCKGNSSNNWNSLTEVEVWGTPASGGGGNDGGGSTGNSPGDILGLTSKTWKLNGFTGSPGSNATYRDDVLKSTGKTFGNYNDDNYFYTDGEWTYFKCYRGLGTSSNSSNPRVELRELSNGKLANWNASNGNNTMTWTVRVDRLPKSKSGKDGVLCFGQIHGPSSTVDDVIRVQFIGSPDQSSGNVRIKISGYITEEVLGGSRILSRTYKLGQSYTFKLTYNNGRVKLFDGSTEIFSQAMDTSTEGNYFKAGNYLQSVKGASYTGSYGLVRIKNLSITH